MADADTHSEKVEPQKVPLVEYEGAYHFDGTEFEKAKNLKCRESDIWVCSFPRSGTTLTQQTTYLIKTLDFVKGTTVHLDDRFPLCEFKSPDYPLWRGPDFLDALPDSEPRFIKSHLHYKHLPTELQKGKGKIIYITRNPKASVPSLYRVLHYVKNPPVDTLREYLETFLSNKNVYACPWAPHVREYWEHRNDPNILFLQFEHTIKDRPGTVRKIADFLGVTLTEEDVNKVVQHTTIESMKTNKSVNFASYDDIFFTDTAFGEFINKDPLLVSPEVIHVLEGENIEAKCIVKDLGKFPNTYNFGWNLKDKKNGTATEESSAGNIKTLKIKNARKQDEGFYRCQLSTDNKKIEKLLQISVIESINSVVYNPCNSKFQCKGGKEIHCYFRCDGNPDCKFGEDEEGCMKTKEIYPKERESTDDHTAWLKTTVYTVIACTVGVVLFISIVVIAVCRIKMKRAAVRRALHQAERRRRPGHGGSDLHGNSSRAQRNNAVEHEPFISAPSPTHFGNIIVNVNNGVQYVPNVDFHAIVQSPPSYQEVLAETQRESVVGRHSPPPIYSTIDRNPHRLSCDVNNQIADHTNVQSNMQIDTNRETAGNTAVDERHAGEGRRSETGDTQSPPNDRQNRTNVPINIDNSFQTSPSVIASGRDGTRSLERLNRNRQGGSRTRPNVRAIAAPRRPKQLQVRDGQIVLDENSSAASSPETVHRNTQTNPADITLSSDNTNTTSSDNNSSNVTQSQTETVADDNDNTCTTPTQNKPAQLRVQAGQIVLDGQSESQPLMTSSVTSDSDTAATGQGHLEVKDGVIVFKTP